MSQSTIYPAPRQWTARMRRGLASRYLAEVHGVQLAPATLAKLACIGGGPRYLKDGLFPLYPVEMLDEFAASRIGPLRGSTSDAPRLGVAERTGSKPCSHTASPTETEPPAKKRLEQPYSELIAARSFTETR